MPILLWCVWFVIGIGMDWNGNQNGYIPDVFGLWLELELEWDLNTRERIGIGAFPFPSGIRMGMGLASTKWLEWESLIPIPILSGLTTPNETCP